jgi:hypothetical protein
MFFTNTHTYSNNQFVIRRYGRSYNSTNIFLQNIPMTFIKSNNRYYNPHTARGMVGTSSQGGNLNAIRRRV